MHGKRLELLREAIPHISRVAFLVEPYQAAVNMKVMEAAHGRSASPCSPSQVQDPTDLEEAFAAMTRERLGGLFVQGGPLTLSHRTRIVELAAKSQLPAIYTLREFVDAGGLMAYGGHLPDMFRRAAAYVDKILKGAKPADLPIERPMKFELVINLKTAKALGLTMPPSLLFLADEVIQ